MDVNVRDALDLLPWRQMVSVEGDAARGLARECFPRWLAKPDQYRIDSHGHGGRILAVSELALAHARAALLRAYGCALTFGMPNVHTYVDPQVGAVMVPVMFLRVDAPRSHAHALRQLLADRGAEIKEVDLQRHRVLLRAELEMSRSLGMERAIGELTGGAAHVLSWLLRYQRASAASPQGPMQPEGKGWLQP